MPEAHAPAKHMATMTLPAGTQNKAAAAKLCRFCGASLRQTFVDLGMSPLCETYPSAADLNRGETYYPLHVYVCGSCFLVQLEEYESAENIFSDYAYFSSFSDSWLQACRHLLRQDAGALRAQREEPGGRGRQ